MTVKSVGVFYELCLNNHNSSKKGVVMKERCVLLLTVLFLGTFLFGVHSAGARTAGEPSFDSSSGGYYSEGSAESTDVFSRSCRPDGGLYFKYDDLNATVTGLKFYEGGYNGVPYEERKYSTVFYQDSARFISYELNLKHPAPGSKAIVVSAQDTAGKTVNSSVSIAVTALTSGSPSAGSSDSYTIVNEIGGRDLNISYSLSSVTVNNREKVFMRAEEGGLFLQIYKPDGTTFLSDAIEILLAVSELVIKNADKGTWTYKVENTSPQTQSFSLKTSASGTGVIAGMVTDSETGDALNGMNITTDAGGTTVTSQGYYVLLHAAGAFTIQITGRDYVPVSRSFILSTGQTVEINAAMNEKGENPKPCSMSVLFSGSENESLDLLRSFRDTALSKTPAGRSYIKKYYAHSQEVTSMMNHDVMLKKELFQFMTGMLSEIAGFISGEPVRFTAEQTAEIRRILHLLKEKAGTELRIEIDNILKKADSELDMGYLIEQR